MHCTSVSDSRTAYATLSATRGPTGETAFFQVVVDASNVPYINTNAPTRLGLGLYVGSQTTNPDDNDIHFDGNLKSMKNSTYYDVYGFVPLDAPLTSTEWDGDPYSTTSKTLIDLSVKFGAPAGIRAVLMRTAIRDSGSAANECVLFLAPNNTSLSGLATDCTGLPNDTYKRDTMIVPCTGGDIYYQITASGTGTMDVSLQIWGYFI
jgi:hypothetical protein